jgi:archaetidylinositol phosphate synthase
VTDTVYAPLGRLLVRVLLPLRVPPVAVVVANGVAGLGAALAVVRGDLLAGALLLWLKTVLDNTDGQLARASGRTSALGRYLDTEVDLLVNVALFAALAHETGSPVLAVASLLALTFVLSADFNADVLYRRHRGEHVLTQPSAEGEGVVAKSLAALYAGVFAPQDRILQRIARRRLGRLTEAVGDSDAGGRVAHAYDENVMVAVLANLGLSTQLTVLGVCLVAGAPMFYLWLVVSCAALVPVLQVRREIAARRALDSRVTAEIVARSRLGDRGACRSSAQRRPSTGRRSPRRSTPRR